MNNKKFLKLYYFVLILLLVTSVQSNERSWSPNGYNSWTDSSQRSKQKILFGGPVQHYRTADSTWEKIDNDWVNHNDTLFSVQNSVLKASVFPNGRSQVSLTIGSQNVTVTKKMVRLILLDNSTGEWRTIDSTVNISARTIDSNIIYWQNYFNHVDYAIIKENGKLQHRIYFTPKFLDTLFKKYSSLPGKENYSLANVIEYTLSNIDSLPKSKDINRRILKKIGKESFKLSSQQLFYKGWDRLESIQIKQKWIIKNSTLYCIEYVPVQFLTAIHQQNQNDTIWHNDSQEFNYTDCEDSYVRSDYADRNQGINNLLYPIVSDASNFGGFIKFDLSVIPSNSVIDSSWMSFQFTTYSMSLNLCRMLTDWDEGTEITGVIDESGEHGVTYNYAKDDYDNSNWNWANGSNFSSSDYDDNSGSYYGQIASGPSYLKDTLFVGSPQTGNMSDLIQKWVDGINQNYGFGIQGTSTNAQIRSSEVFLEEMRPMLFVEWTTPPAQDISIRRRQMSNIRR